MGKRKIEPLQALRLWADSLADKAKFALLGWRFLLSKPRYAWGCSGVSLLILYVLTFFQDGTSNWRLLWSGISFGQKLQVLGRGWGAVLSDFLSLYGLLLVLLAIMQGLCITAVVYAIRQNNRQRAIDGASSGGLAAILSFLALGCPSCGLTFLTPILSTLAGAGAIALAESLSRIFMIIAVVVLLYSLIQLGYFIFVTASTTPRKEKKRAKSN